MFNFFLEMFFKIATCFPGFDKRLTEELKNVVPTATAASVKVHLPEGIDGTVFFQLIFLKIKIISEN